MVIPLSFQLYYLHIYIKNQSQEISLNAVISFILYEAIYDNSTDTTIQYHLFWYRRNPCSSYEIGKVLNITLLLLLKRCPKAKVPFSVKYNSIDSLLPILHKSLFKNDSIPLLSHLLWSGKSHQEGRLAYYPPLCLRQEQ